MLLEGATHGARDIVPTLIPNWTRTQQPRPRLSISHSCLRLSVKVTEFFCPSIIRFLSKSSIECSTRTVPMMYVHSTTYAMSDIVAVGLICNRIGPYCGIWDY